MSPDPTKMSFAVLPHLDVHDSVLPTSRPSQVSAVKHVCRIAKLTLEYLGMRVANLTNAEIKDAEIDTIRDIVTEHSVLFKKHYSTDQTERFIEEQ